MRSHIKNTKAIFKDLTSNAIKYNDLHKNDSQNENDTRWLGCGRANLTLILEILNAQKISCRADHAIERELLRATSMVPILLALRCEIHSIHDPPGKGQSVAHKYVHLTDRRRAASLLRWLLSTASLTIGLRHSRHSRFSLVSSAFPSGHTIAVIHSTNAGPRETRRHRRPGDIVSFLYWSGFF